jgi:hypothetical protein
MSAGGGARCGAAMRNRLDADQSRRARRRDACAHKSRRTIMSTETALVVAAITFAFALFGVVLAWVDYYTRHAPKSHG